MKIKASDYLLQCSETMKKSSEVLSVVLEEMAVIITDKLKKGGKLIVFGNGGSAADAQHIVCELVGSFLIKDRKPLAAIALNTNTSSLTSISNDFGYEDIFSKQIEALGQSNDIALGISTSGNSENVNLALKKARELGITTMGFAGKSGGKMVELCDKLMIVPSDMTPNIQEVHITSGHAICAIVEENLA